MNSRLKHSRSNTSKTYFPLKKRLGQFLLRDSTIAVRIAEAVPVEPLIVEVGPGDGALTRELLDSGHRVIGVELDNMMVKKLEQRFNHRRDFRLISGDILDVDWNSISNDNEDLVVVGNLPYHLTSPILFNVFDSIRLKQSRIVSVIVMAQKEVGVRLTAESGGREYGSLTLLAKFHGTPEYLFTVPASSFHPKPGVDGGVIKITFRKQDSFPDVRYNDFRRVVRGCFAQRRKMMRNALCVVTDLPEGWQELEYDFTLRPEQFSFDDFIRLTRDLVNLQSVKDQ